MEEITLNQTQIQMICDGDWCSYYSELIFYDRSKITLELVIELYENYITLGW